MGLNKSCPQFPKVWGEDRLVLTFHQTFSVNGCLVGYWFGWPGGKRLGVHLRSCRGEDASEPGSMVKSLPTVTKARFD